MKYQDTPSMRTRQHSVWIVVLPEGKYHGSYHDEETRIAIWHKNADIEDVHRYYARTFDRFRLAQLGVGEHMIGDTYNSYMDDARWVDQDWNVKLRFS